MSGDMAQSLAITPKRGKDHKAPKQDGERHEKVSSLEFSAGLGEPEKICGGLKV